MTNVNFAIAIYCYYNEIEAVEQHQSLSIHGVHGHRTGRQQHHPDLAEHHHPQRDRIFDQREYCRHHLGPTGVARLHVTLSGVNFQAPSKTFCMYHAQGVQIIDSNLSAPNTVTNTLTLYDAQVTITNTVGSTTWSRWVDWQCLRPTMR